jgi:hypothetical protein
MFPRRPQISKAAMMKPVFYAERSPSIVTPNATSINLEAILYKDIQRLAVSWRSGARFPIGSSDFSLPHRVQTFPGASYLMGYPYPGIKRPGRESDHSAPYSGKVKRDGVITSFPYAHHSVEIN